MLTASGGQTISNATTTRSVCLVSSNHGQRSTVLLELLNEFDLI
jgi:hypothetical protein